MRYCSGNTSSSHRDTRDGPEFETFGQVHRADREPAGGCLFCRSIFLLNVQSRWR